MVQAPVAIKAIAKHVKVTQRVPSKVPIAPTPEDSNTPLSGYLVPIAPATNLARKFLGTSHVSSRVRARDPVEPSGKFSGGVPSRVRARDRELEVGQVAPPQAAPTTASCLPKFLGEMIPLPIAHDLTKVL